LLVLTGRVLLQQSVYLIVFPVSIGWRSSAGLFLLFLLFLLGFGAFALAWRRLGGRPRWEGSRLLLPCRLIVHLLVVVVLGIRIV